MFGVGRELETGAKKLRASESVTISRIASTSRNVIGESLGVVPHPQAVLLDEVRVARRLAHVAELRRVAHANV